MNIKKGTKEDAESYVNFLAVADSSCSAYAEEIELLREWSAALEFFDQTKDGLLGRPGYTKEQEEATLAHLRYAEAPLLEILVELRSMMKARKAQPSLPMEVEP